MTTAASAIAQLRQKVASNRDSVLVDTSRRRTRYISGRQLDGRIAITVERLRAAGTTRDDTVLFVIRPGTKAVVHLAALLVIGFLLQVGGAWLSRAPR